MRFFTLLLLLLLAVSSPASAQESLDLTLNGVGLSIGDSEQVIGLRLNYRDGAMQKVTGINATIWMPYKNRGGDVHGLAWGLGEISRESWLGVWAQVPDGI